MKIHPVEHGHHARHSMTLANSAHQARPTGQFAPPEAEPPDSDVRASDEPVAGGTPPTPEAGDGEKVRGVIRLLEAGHFKGVADVRLRINFFEELSARAAAAAAPVVEEQSGALVETVRGAAVELIAGLELDEATGEVVNGLVSDFDGAVQAAVEEFNAAGALDTPGLTAAITSAFNTLVDALRGLLTAPVPEPEPAPNPDPTKVPAEEGAVAEPVPGPAEEPGLVEAVDGIVATVSQMLPDLVAAAVAGDATAEQEAVPTDAVGQPGDVPADVPNDTPTEYPTAGVEGALAALIEAFEEALAGLLGSISSATQLPELSPPNGNGVAYDKFLAIYNNMLGGSSGDVDDVG
jgi:hypothetical protein